MEFYAVLKGNPERQPLRLHKRYGTLTGAEFAAQQASIENAYVEVRADDRLLSVWSAGRRLG